MFRKKNSDLPVVISNTQGFEVMNFEDSVLSLDVRVESAGFTKNSAQRLKVKITNSGEKPLENLFLEAFSPPGVELSDPGALFGSARRHVRIPELNPGKSITYKLELRGKPGFSSGALKIFIRSAFREKAHIGAHYSLALSSRS